MTSNSFMHRNIERKEKLINRTQLSYQSILTKGNKRGLSLTNGAFSLITISVENEI
jgi:hypothetical protein